MRVLAMAAKARQLLILGAMGLFGIGLGAGCLVPVPEHIRTDDDGVAPEIDLGFLSPSQSFFEADTKCNCFKVSLDRVSDADDDTLVVRFATNLGRLGREKCFDEFTTAPALRPVRIGTTLIPAESFVDFPTETVHTISVFVTDAPAFAKNAQAEPGACGQIPSAGDAGAGRAHVVAHQWTVRFVDGVTECFGCTPAGN